MSEPTPVFDPPVENATSAVGTEGSAPAAATTDNGGAKENNSQDVTMAGLEGAGVKAAKAGAEQTVSDAIFYLGHRCFDHTSTMTFTMAITSIYGFQLHPGLISFLYITPLEIDHTKTIVPQATTLPPPQKQDV